jgi:hypothetical protein
MGGVHWTRLATREDVLAAVRELGGVGIESVMFGDSHEVAHQVSEPGRYLIVPLDTGDTE